MEEKIEEIYALAQKLQDLVMELGELRNREKESTPTGVPSSL